MALALMMNAFVGWKEVQLLKMKVNVCSSDE